MIKFAGVVVLYNPTEKDLKNINTYIDYLDKLYVIDNSDNGGKKINFSHKKIEYIFNNENLGVAKALNIGVQKANKDNYKWLLTMDQDTKLNNKIFDKMTKTISEYDTGKIGILTPWHNTRLNSKKPKQKIDYPLDVMTSGNFVNLDILNEIGGFKEEFFIDGIDIEFCLRLKKNLETDA